MKSDSFRNNRKALAALLLCTGFIAGQPLTVRATGNEQSVQTVQQQIKVSGTVSDAMGPVIGASVVEKGIHLMALLLMSTVTFLFQYLPVQRFSFPI